MALAPLRKLRDSTLGGFPGRAWRVSERWPRRLVSSVRPRPGPDDGLPLTYPPGIRGEREGLDHALKGIPEAPPADAGRCHLAAEVRETEESVQASQPTRKPNLALK